MIGIVPYSEEGLLVKRILESYVPEEVKRETIVLLLQILERIPYAVVGGFAVSFYYKGARPVSSDDFDVKVLPENLEDVFDSLKLRGFVLKRKNFLDIAYIVKGGKADIDKARKLVRKFLPSDLEDFESIVLYAQRFDDAKLKEIFGIEEVGG